MIRKTASFEIHLKVSSQFNADFGKDKMFDGVLDEHNDVWHPETGDNTPKVELNFKVVQFSLCLNTDDSISAFVACYALVRHTSTRDVRPLQQHVHQWLFV